MCLHLIMSHLYSPEWFDVDSEWQVSANEQRNLFYKCFTDRWGFAKAVDCFVSSVSFMVGLRARFLDLGRFTRNVLERRILETSVFVCVVWSAFQMVFWCLISAPYAALQLVPLQNLNCILIKLLTEGI